MLSLHNVVDAPTESNIQDCNANNIAKKSEKKIFDFPVCHNKIILSEVPFYLV